MKKGILGRKIGMTEVFDKNGKLMPVTVVYVDENIVTQIKTMETDGYEAIQLAFDPKREKLSNKPEAGHLKKANTTPKRFFREIKDIDLGQYSLGQSISVNIFEAGEVVDVTGISKGKGFQGNIKRHNQSRGPMSHGSQNHRLVGSLGTMKPMRVFKGKKLPGHMGHVLVTVQNLEIIAIDTENKLLLIKGNVPGPKGGLVVVKTATKKEGTINKQLDLVGYDEKIEETIENEINEEANEEINETSEEPKEEVLESALEKEEPVLEEESPQE